jgi:hypothetical protein
MRTECNGMREQGGRIGKAKRMEKAERRMGGGEERRGKGRGEGKRESHLQKIEIQY